MISIIICSRTISISERLLINIEETIGVEFELIIIDNSETKYSIFEAYNIGLEKSKNEIVCFIHDDINILTKNWGNILVDIFENNVKIGLIGISGSSSKTKMPSPWWHCPKKNFHINIIQYFPDKTKVYWLEGFENNNVEEVVAIDGVFMAARKTETISFNDNLSGFHNYDLNLSFEYLKKGYTIVVTKNILLEHYSLGSLNESWHESTLKIHKLYRDLLPLNKLENSLKKQEFENGVNFCTNLLKFKMRKSAFSLWLKLIYMNPVSRFHFYFLKKILR